MVNIRAILERAVADGVVVRPLACRLSEIGKALFYKERSWEAMFRLAAAAGLRVSELLARDAEPVANVVGRIFPPVPNDASHTKVYSSHVDQSLSDRAPDM
jgi:hypothetical protein